MLFNLFAETFPEILDNALAKANLQVEIIHYLEDFLIILPTNHNRKSYSRKFSHLCGLVGLPIKVAKNEEGKVASFGGVEVDTDGNLYGLLVGFEYCLILSIFYVSFPVSFDTQYAL